MTAIVVSGKISGEGKEGEMDEAWNDLNEEVIIPCFDCGDDVVVDALLEAEAVLCDMCSLNWNILISEQNQATSNY